MCNPTSATSLTLTLNLTLTLTLTLTLIDKGACVILHLLLGHVDETVKATGYGPADVALDAYGEAGDRQGTRGLGLRLELGLRSGLGLG